MPEADYSALFSRQAGLYAQFRPTYPPEWFAFLAGLVTSHDTALDVATGSGQAVPGLARHFRNIFACDPSLKQLAHRQQAPGVDYFAARAENLPLPPASVDLLAAAQAAHWFEMDAFNAEARRLLRPGGVIAIWMYEMPHISAGLDAVIHRLYSEITGPYWSPRRRLVDDHYRSLPFPFEEVSVPEFAILIDWNLENLVGYISSWSAAQEYLRVHGQNPLALVQQELLEAWGDPQQMLHTRWPISARVGRV